MRLLGDGSARSGQFLVFMNIIKIKFKQILTIFEICYRFISKPNITFNDSLYECLKWAKKSNDFRLKYIFE